MAEFNADERELLRMGFESPELSSGRLADMEAAIVAATATGAAGTNVSQSSIGAAAGGVAKLGAVAVLGVILAVAASGRSNRAARELKTVEAVAPPEIGIPSAAVAPHVRPRARMSVPPAPPSLRRPAPNKPTTNLNPVAELNSLAAQIRELDRARAALLRKDHRRALRQVRAHVRRYRSSPLAEERALLEVEVLCRGGDKAAGRRRLRRFAARWRHSVLIAKAREACADPEDAAP